MRRLQDISESAARRAFLVTADDTRTTIRVEVEADAATFPDAASEGDIMGELYKEWQPASGVTNDDVGRLLINIGLELRLKGELQHLDGQNPTV